MKGHFTLYSRKDFARAISKLSLIPPLAMSLISLEYNLIFEEYKNYINKDKKLNAEDKRIRIDSAKELKKFIEAVAKQKEK